MLPYLSLKKYVSQRSFIFATIALFAFFLQVQITIFSSETYSGIRLSAADFLIPISGVVIVSTLLLKKSAWPPWNKPFGYWCMALIAAALFYGLLNGYFLRGELTRWALVNKFTGWFVLCAYLGAAGWLVANGSMHTIRNFYYVFIAGFCAIGLFSLLHYFLFWEVGSNIFGEAPYNIQGFMYNRNSYAFLLITVLLACVFLSNPYTHVRKLEYWLHACLWLILPGIVYLNGSRALWLCLLFLIPLLITQYKSLPLKHILTFFLIGIVSTAFLFPNNLLRGVHPFQQSIMLLAGEENRASVAKKLGTQPGYNDLRIQNIERALNFIQEYPLRGAGLGAILEQQKENNAQAISVLDNTPLWILSEMGVFGLLSFSLVYLVMLKAMMMGQNIKNASPRAKLGLSLMLFFGIFSLFHEIFYSRFFWFICAMSLVSMTTRPTEHN